MEPEVAEIEEPLVEDLGPLKTLDLADEHALSVDTEKRILGLRVLRYNEVVEHPMYGRLLFQPGAFVKPDPAAVRLRMDHEDPPTGLGLTYRDEPDAPYMDFRVSKTQRGDEQLTLARDGVSRGTSPGYREVPGKPQQKLVGGKLTTVYGPASVVLGEVSTTWTPTFEGDGVMYVLSKDEKGSGPVAETQEGPVTAPVVTPGIDYDAMAAAFAKAVSSATSESKIDQLLAKFDGMVELQRSQFAVPQGDAKPKMKLHNWFTYAAKSIANVRMSATEIKELALDDVVTTEQPGLVPDVLKADYDDIISQNRPFLSSTREVTPPATGTSMVLPIITTRAVAGTQAGSAEKGALTTTAPKWGTGTFAYASVFSGADVSIQMIQRADASFLDLLSQEFGEAYGYDCDKKALTALLAGYTDSASGAHTINNGGNIDPEDPHFGEAWENSILAMKAAPDTIWLSAAGVRAFIDAKAPLTNAPLYGNLAGAFSAANGPGGTVSGLRPVYVPAMDANLKVDVIVGPSRGFVWAEDPALRLDAPVPSVAGRDIALVGGIFPAPRYANAFTKYNVATS